MTPLYYLLGFLFIGLTFASIDDPSYNTNDSDFSCNCDHCDGVIRIEDDDKDDNEDRTICARDRDVEDRSFPSICHMICHNSCTRYRIYIYTEKKEKKYIASAFRTNYYKLKDGPC